MTNLFRLQGAFGWFSYTTSRDTIGVKSDRPYRTADIEGLRAWDDAPDRTSISIGIRLFSQHPNGGLTATMIMDEVLGVPLTAWGQASVNTNASKTKIDYGRWGLVALLVLPIAFWYLASPVVVVNFSHEGKDVFKYIWNTQHRIYKGKMPRRGGASVEWGHIFPDKDFFMRFDWWTDTGAQRCFYVTPKWGKTIEIYLDATGRIDTAKTDPDVISRLTQCAGEPDPFQP